MGLFGEDEFRVTELRLLKSFPNPTVKVSRTTDQKRHGLGNRLQHVRSSFTRSNLGVGRELGNLGHQRSRVDLVGHTVFEQLGQVGVRSLPGIVFLGPFGVGGGTLGLELGKEIAGLLGDEKVLRGGQAEGSASGVDEFGASFTVSLGGTGDFRDSFADEGLGNDEVGLALDGLGVGQGGGKRVHVVAIDGLHVPAQRLEAHGGVLILGGIGHRVEGHVVRVVDEDQVVELGVAGKRDGLERDTLLHAAVSGKDDGAVVKEITKAGSEHFARNSVADTVGDTLTEGTGGGLDSGRVLELLRVTGRLGVKLAESLDVIERQTIVSSEMQPRVDEHGTVPRREHKAVSAQPFRRRRVKAQRIRRAKEHSAHLGTAQGQAQVARIRLVHGVHGQAAGLVGSALQGGRVECSSSSHRVSQSPDSTKR